MTRFVRDGLEANDQVWYLTDALPPVTVLDFLRAGEVPVDDAMAAGQLVPPAPRSTWSWAMPSWVRIMKIAIPMTIAGTTARTIFPVGVSPMVRC